MGVSRRHRQWAWAAVVALAVSLAASAVLAPAVSAATVSAPAGSAAAVSAAAVSAPAVSAAAVGAAPAFSTADDTPLAGDTGVIYLGEWSTGTGPAKYLGADQYSAVADSRAAVVFTGVGARLYGSRAAGNGIVAFSVDGGGWTTVDLYARTRVEQSLLYEASGLAAGSHTLTMRITGSKNPAASGIAGSLDRIEVTATGPVSAFVTRAGSQLQLGGAPFRFAGANLYWLGLDDNLTDSGGATYPTKYRIDNGLQSAASAGFTVVRSHTLGISVGCARCLEPTLGVFNDTALQSADYAIYRAGQLGLKLMIPLTDQWRWYHGGISTFTGWRGYPNYGSSTDNAVNAANNADQRASEAHFYSDSTVSDDFKQYITHLLEHVNPYTGLAYKDDPTIMAWETGNEIWTANPTWTQDIAWFIKHKVGARQLVTDGTAATGMQVAAAAVDAADVDILGGHFYPVDTAWMKTDAAVAAAKNKAYVVGEYAWTDRAATAALTAAVQGNPQISGALVWTLMPYREDGTPEVHGDGYALYNPATTPSMAAILGILKAHAKAMSGN